MSIQQLTKADYRMMPWANGLGQTVEIFRHDDANGEMLWRLSMATVTEDGPFSLFPEVERNLTVLSGDGFDLVEHDSGIQHRAALLTPVAFAGDVVVTAKHVTAPCQDFNVMTRRGLAKPLVSVVHKASTLPVTGDQQLALFALTTSTVRSPQKEFTLKPHELLLSQQPLELLDGSLITVVIAAAMNNDSIGA